MKRNLFIAIACSVVAVACHNATKNLNPGGFTINGTIKGMDSGWIYFGHSDSTGFIEDSVHVKGARFTYKGKVAEPVAFYLWMKKTEGKMVDPFDFFVEDTMMQMNVDKDSLKATTVTGSDVEAQYLEYKEVLRTVREKLDAISKSYFEALNKGNKAATDSIGKVHGLVAKEEQQIIESYVTKNPSSVIGAWSVSRNLMYSADLKTIQMLYAKFTPEVKQSSYGKTIKKKIDVDEHLQVGMTAPDFTQNDSTGKPVSLSSFRGKYVLVDFWASWCGPCRRENPNVVEVYKKFKDKNFTILGVSLDDDKSAWEKAIAKDGLTWNHVCDLKGWRNVVAEQYGIQAVPSNFLLDPDGKILAHNLRGEELEKTLAETIK